jgi:hypothetical protein
MSFTPGPWEWERDGDEDGMLINRELYDAWQRKRAPQEGEFPIVLIGVWHNDSTAGVSVHNPADARLIAAAPDLFELARAVVNHFRDTDAPLGQLARQAIAKAEGK